MTRYFYLAAIIAFGIDQFSKWFVVFQLDLINRLYLEVWPGFLNFAMGWNTGINFGLFSGQQDMMRWVLIGLALLICVLIVFWCRSDKRWLPQLCAGLVVGGALGNVLDRVIYGAVADFLNVTCCGVQNPFSFNIADVWVFAGAIGLVLFKDQEPT